LHILAGDHAGRQFAVGIIDAHGPKPSGAGGWESRPQMGTPFDRFGESKLALRMSTG
jgi:hypothetical protein